MPTYEYECTKCGHTFEALQNMSDKPISRCPKCKSSVRRLIHGGLGVIFKGSGFYSTDNKRGSAATLPTKSESKSEGKSESKSEGSSESKPKVETKTA